MSAPSDISGSLVPVTREQAMLLLEAGHLWMDLGEFDKAHEVLAGAALLMPKSEVPQLSLGTLELARGKPEKALQAFRAAQKLSPRSGVARAHAGEALLFLGKSAEALKELKAARELEPGGDGGKLAEALEQAHAAGAFPAGKR